MTDEKTKEKKSILDPTRNSEIINDLLTENPGFSYQAGHALFFSAACAALGTVLIPIPVLGSALGAVIGGAIGASWGKRQWEKQFKKIKEAGNAGDNVALTNSVVQVKNNPSFVNHIPVIGHAYRSIKSLSKSLSKKINEKSKKIKEKSDEYEDNIMVADLTSGVGLAVGYQIGFMVGSLIAPGIGTLIGAGVGAVVGLVGGMLLGAKGSSLLAGKLKIEYGHQRIAAAGAIAGAGLGAAIGGLIGTFIFPGAGTAIGAAIGASVGAMAGGVYSGVSHDKTKENGFLDKFSNLFSMGPGVSGGAMLGGILGTIVAPGLGTAVGAAIGAVVCAGLAWAVTKYGNYLNKQDDATSDDIKHKFSGRPNPSSDVDLANDEVETNNTTTNALTSILTAQQNDPANPENNSLLSGEKTDNKLSSVEVERWRLARPTNTNNPSNPAATTRSKWVERQGIWGKTSSGISATVSNQDNTQAEHKKDDFSLTP